MQLLEHRPLERHHLLIADVRIVAQRLQLRVELRMIEPCRNVRRVVQLGNGFDVDIQRIAKEPADGAIRADGGPRIRQRVEGVDADECATESSRPPNELRQVRQVANAPIPLRLGTARRESGTVFCRDQLVLYLIEQP